MKTMVLVQNFQDFHAPGIHAENNSLEQTHASVKAKGTLKF